MNKYIIFAYSNPEDKDQLNSKPQIESLSRMIKFFPVEIIFLIYRYVLQTSFSLTTLLSFIDVDPIWSLALEKLILANVRLKKFDDKYRINGIDGIVKFESCEFNSMVKFIKTRNIHFQTLQFQTKIDDIKELDYMIQLNLFKSIRIVINFTDIQGKSIRDSLNFTSYIIQLSKRPDINLTIHFHQYFLENTEYSLWQTIFKKTKLDATKSVLKIDNLFIDKFGLNSIDECKSLKILIIHFSIFQTSKIVFTPRNDSIEKLIINVNHCFYQTKILLKFNGLTNLKYVDLKNFHFFEDIFHNTGNNITELKLIGCIFHVKNFTYPKHLKKLEIKDCSPNNYFNGISSIISLKNLSVTGRNLPTSNLLENINQDLSTLQIEMNMKEILIQNTDHLMIKKYTLLKKMEQPKYINLNLLPPSLLEFRIFVTTDERKAAHQASFRKQLLNLSFEFKTRSKDLSIDFDNFETNNISFQLNKGSLITDLRNLQVYLIKKVSLVVDYGLTILSNNLEETLYSFEIEQKDMTLPILFCVPKTSDNSSNSESLLSHS